MSARFVVVATVGLMALTAGCGSKSNAGAGMDAGTGPGTSVPPNDPVGLIVTFASRTEIDLAWAASATPGVTYEVQRSPVGGAWASVATALTGTTWADTGASSPLDPDTDYTYRVRAVNAAGSSHWADADHPAGPPPSGFQIAAPAPVGSDSTGYGLELSMALDGNGDPALAFDWMDPDQNGDASDSNLNFVSWSRADFVWNAPVQVDTVGSIDTNSPFRQVSLSYDSSSGTFGIAYQATDGAGSPMLKFATSADDGVTWSSPVTVEPSSGGEPDEPSLALARDTVHLAYYVSGTGVLYREGATSADPSTWSSTLAPTLPADADTGEAAATLSFGYGISLALDGTGAPGIAYWLEQAPATGGTDSELAFWRPPDANATEIADSDDNSVDVTDVALAFSGTSPVVAHYVDRDDPVTDLEYTLWVSTSPDDGADWNDLMPIPRDGSSSLDPNVDLAVGPEGQMAVVADSASGQGACGLPKLSRSTDLSSWTTCSPDATNAEAIEGGLSGFQTVRFAENGKLYIAVRNDAQNAPPLLGDGVIVWHEP